VKKEKVLQDTERIMTQWEEDMEWVLLLTVEVEVTDTTAVVVVVPMVEIHQHGFVELEL
jgi:hypothetical protein